MNDKKTLTPEQQAYAEDNDPWTLFGSFSDADIAAVRQLLEQAAVTFSVGPDGLPGTPPSLTPHCLWVHNDHVARAESILVPYFQARNEPKS